MTNHASQPAYAQPPAPAKPRKKRRVFLWFFVAIQAIFIVLLIVQGTASPGGPTAHQQAVEQCNPKSSDTVAPLYQSYAQCVKDETSTLSGAGDLGRGVGFGLIIILWVVVDFLVTIPWAVYRLATRNR